MPRNSTKNIHGKLIEICPFSNNLMILLRIRTSTIQHHDGMSVNIYIQTLPQRNGDKWNKLSFTTCFRILSVIYFMYVIFNTQ